MSEHLSILRQGVSTWNRWRNQNPEIRPTLLNVLLTKPKLAKANLSNSRLVRTFLIEANLTGANLREAELIEAYLPGSNLRGADLTGANLSGACLDRVNLSGANLAGARLIRTGLDSANLIGANLARSILHGAWLVDARLNEADLSGAQLIDANLTRADLSKTNLTRAQFSRASLFKAKLCRANLREASLIGAYLSRADLGKSELSGANLSDATLVEANLEKATIEGCRVHGASAWNVKLKDTKQSNLIITLPSERSITVDNLEIAQFIYLLLNNEKIREVIDATASRVVLILGRFTPERKSVLDAIRDKLRSCNRLPVLVDFEKPRSRDLTETVATLAHMARFVIVDLTDARSVPQELSHIVEGLPSVPVQPLLQASAEEYGMFDHFKKYPWVLPIYRYRNRKELLDSLEGKVVAPAERKVRECQKTRSHN